MCRSFKELKSRTKQVGECLLWQGNKLNGYGVIKHKGKRVLTHRLAYEKTKGPIPAGAFICHTCDRRSCLNPDHLWAGTAADNNADMRKKGRAARGERNAKAKLTWKAVRLMRKLYKAGHTQVALAKRFRTHQTNVSMVVAGKTWREE